MKRIRKIFSGWRGFRRIIQGGFLILFLILTAAAQAPPGAGPAGYIEATGQDLRLSSPVSLFFDFDPLVGLSTMLSGWTLKPSLLISLAVLLGVIFLGRFFCGFICPFGAFNQVFVQTGRKDQLKDKAARNKPASGQKLKYYLLAFVLLAAVLGSNQSGLLDPISFMYRGLALSIFPGLGALVDSASSFLADQPKPIGYLGYMGPMLLNRIFGPGFLAYKGGFLFGLLFTLILIINKKSPRFFCRNLCPLGALLGLFSRYSILNLTKDPDLCTDCGLCRADCPGACNPHPEDPWLRSECHLCFNCQAVCPHDALKFKFQAGSPKPSPSGHSDAPDIGRRTVLASLAGSFFFVGMARSSKASPDKPLPELVRPPGSIDEKEFLKKCVRCGLCMRVCPTNVLSPTLMEAGVEGIWTPYLDFNLGYCEYSCTLCSSVCPTGAIRLITGKEKTETPIVIGSSFFDRGRCLPWSGQGPCLVCEEVCPTSPKAIFLTPMEVATDKEKSQKLMVPQVNLSRCVGCGVCSNKCPVQGRPAVYVNSVGETRSSSNRILLPRKSSGEK